MKEAIDESDKECYMRKRERMLQNIQLVDVETIILHGLQHPASPTHQSVQELLSEVKDRKREGRKKRRISDKGEQEDVLLKRNNTPPAKDKCGGELVEDSLMRSGASNDIESVVTPPLTLLPPKHHLISPEILSNPQGHSGALAYTDHLLSEISVVLPAMSSSQVSSVLSALEPPPGTAAPAPDGKPPHPEDTSKVLVKMETLAKDGPHQDSSQTHKCGYESWKAGSSASWYKCKGCCFLATEKSLMEGHCAVDDHRKKQPTKLTCIACSNVFLSTASLKIHLSSDHQVLAGDLHNMLTTVLLVNRIWKTESKLKGKLNGVVCVTNSEDTGPSSNGRECQVEEGSHSFTQQQSNTFSLFESMNKLMDGERVEQGKVEEDDDSVKPKMTLKEEREPGLRCDIEGCTLRFVYPATMEYHKRCHSGRGWKCAVCDAGSPSWSQLSVHLWKAHSVDLELHSCQQCNYKTNSLSRLINDHSRIHGEERPFVCDFCGKAFKNTHQLRNHKGIHKAKKSSSSRECELCGRRFSGLRMLKQHTDIVHRKLRPYLCSICGHAAGSKGSFRMHTRTHTGEKPFRCPHCEYVTNDHNSLRRHKMQHTGAKHYTCPFCPYACIQATTYKTHLRNKHPGMDVGLMFSCEYCTFKTLKKENFITHSSLHTENRGAQGSTGEHRGAQGSPPTAPVPQLLQSPSIEHT